MGYGFYTVAGWVDEGRHPTYDGRAAGYLVIATCDAKGCDAEIDRGLGYLCGDEPHGPWDAAKGCGRYYCGEHLGFVGPRGGCQHRGKRAWGRTLSDLVPNADGSVVCCDPVGHDGPHAWAREDEE